MTTHEAVAQTMIRVILSFMVLLALALGACAKKPIEFAIVSADPKLNGLWTVWTPSGADVVPVFELAKSYLKSIDLSSTADAYSKRSSHEILAQWDSYSCQVVGIVFEGKQLVHFQFLAPYLRDLPGTDWRKSYLPMADGGTSVWRIDFDPATGLFTNFRPGG